MNSSFKQSVCPRQWSAAFTLIEIVAVIAILMGLLIGGVSLLEGTASQSRKAATDLLGGMIEKARTQAISSRCYVILAIAEPGDLPATDGQCKVGLFQLKPDDWPDPATPPLALDATLLGRWQNLFSGVVPIGDDVGGGVNLINQPQIFINYGKEKNSGKEFHAIIFSPQGGIKYPLGSAPVVVRLAEGGYRDGKATPFRRGNQNAVIENHLKIGRVTGRAYRIDL
jgi:type II secretory pathway pseudopilin PulG